MKKRLLFAVLAPAGVGGILLGNSLTAPAELRTFLVRLPTGSVIKVTVDAPSGVPMSQVPGLPGTPIEEITQSAPPPVGSGGGGGGGGPLGGTPAGNGSHQGGGSSGGGGGGSTTTP